ncbi:MAG: hypothetical protein K2Q22_12775, partial [Cytophagales bacterium]|nr:hypothetical protein [Cytophagales bacterium]
MENIFTPKLHLTKSTKSLGGIFCSLLVFLVFGFTELVYSEGTKQLIPDPTRNQGAIQIWDGGAGSAALRTFLTYNSNGEPLKRLNIKICNSGEKVYFGILAENNDVFFRIKDKDGNTVQLFRVSTTGGTTVETPVRKPNNYTSAYVNGSGSIINASATPIASPNQFTYRMPWMSTMTGFIQNYAQAAAGPAVSAVALANGYSVANGYRNAFFFTATNPGDYYVEANPVFPDSVVTTGAFSTMTNRRFPFFDITVTDVNDKIQSGRVWSGFWDLTCYSFTNLFNGSFFVYTT